MGEPVRRSYVNRKFSPQEASVDPAVGELIEKAEKDNVETVWRRFLDQQPQCGFGLLGLCCRNCLVGPCRIDPYGYGPSRGVCGATADTIVARNLLRMVSAGASAHLMHAVEVLKILGSTTENGASYSVVDAEKLFSLAEKLGIEAGKRDIKTVVAVLLEEISSLQDKTMRIPLAYAPEDITSVWRRVGVEPRSTAREIVEALHRTGVGCDADPLSLLLQCFRTAISDCWGASLVTVAVQDSLLGSPRPMKTAVNLSVLGRDTVNIVVAGHNPLLADKIVEASMKEDLVELAKSLEARGINVVGLHSTGMDLASRKGLAVAGDYLTQELVVATGAVEAFVADYHCVIPSLPNIASCYHTIVFTTSDTARLPGAEHVPVDPRNPMEAAESIVRKAIENYKRRSQEKVYIPDKKVEIITGYSRESLAEVLGGSLKPLADALRNGMIRGIVCVLGCVNPRVKHGAGHITVTRELIKNNILVLGAGCWAIASASAGLLSPSARNEAGESLAGFCENIGTPPCLHMGSCTEIPRILSLLAEIASEAGASLRDMPFAVSFPEIMSEKMLSLSFSMVASGLLTHLGVIPPIGGSTTLRRMLTEDMEGVLGGKFLFDADPKRASEALIEHIEAQRKRLRWD